VPKKLFDDPKTLLVKFLVGIPFTLAIGYLIKTGKLAEDWAVSRYCSDTK
jgi:hypothetical protein